MINLSAILSPIIVPKSMSQLQWIMVTLAHIVVKSDGLLSVVTKHVLGGLGLLLPWLPWRVGALLATVRLERRNDI